MKVQKPKFDEMCKKVSCAEIIEGRVVDTVFVNGVEYVITGSIGSGRTGTTKVWGYEVVDIHKYHGDVPALTYDQHRIQVYKGKRERSYTGQSTKHGNRTIVFIGKQVEFEPTQEGTQVV